ncbi:MAG TPA: GNAT family N-acetyltransferase [Candidatus Cloacimonadota bacterium]|nr:GNAT family N-acetyltransferase [Candidatus Cloacimonadota bacterium]
MITINRHQNVSQPEFEQVMQIWLQTGLANPARADDRETVQRTLDHGGCLLIAWEGERAMGSSWLTHDFRRLYIHHMGVLPEFQNQGIGKALLGEALEIAHELGYQAKLEVFETNAKALHLYYSFGFENLERYYTLIKRRV